MACPSGTKSSKPALPALDATTDEYRAVPILMFSTKGTGETRQYYLQNNPWKFVEWNKYQKIFLFCVICGQQRFTQSVWDHGYSQHNGPAVCLNSDCRKSSLDILDYVPESYFYNIVD